MQIEWNSEEIQLLCKVKGSENNGQWSSMMNQLNNREKRKTQLECQRKWKQLFNQDLNSPKWKTNELKILHNLYERHSSHWALIQKSIPSKNKIQIRNKFYGTLRNFIRFLLQYFQVSCGSITYVSNKIKPLILQKLYNSTEEFQFTNRLIKKAIFDMNYVIEKEKLAQFVSLDQETYSKILKVLLKRSRVQKKSNKIVSNTVKQAIFNRRQKRNANDEKIIEKNEGFESYCQQYRDEKQNNENQCLSAHPEQNQFYVIYVCQNLWDNGFGANWNQNIFH